MKKRTKLLAAILSACMMVIPVSAQEYSYRGSAASTTDAREFTLGQLGQSDGIMTLSGDSDDSTVSFNENEYGVLYCTNKLRMQYGLQPLSATAKLQKAAQIRSSELPTLNSHTRPNGSDCFSVKIATNPMFAGFVAIFSFQLPKIGLYMFSINVQHINLYQKINFLLHFISSFLLFVT